ncbi:MAG: hypothetical protein RBR06_11285 [Desulfuromonadaceae bacterium]|nr:hypothetical protein [Desulfuromonadaceae bacterium]
MPRVITTKTVEAVGKARFWCVFARCCMGVMLVLALFITGCSKTTLYPTPVVPKYELSVEQMHTILERSYQYESMQALAQVRFSSGKERQSSTQALHVQSPYLLRAEVYNFMGRMMVLLVADGTWMEAYVPSRNALYRGLATRARMERFAYVPLVPADMVALLLQRLPPGVMQLAEVKKGAGNSLVFTLNAQEDYVVGFTLEGVESITYRQLDREIFKLDYLDVKPLNSEMKFSSDFSATEVFPRTMVLSMHEQNLRLELKLEDLQLNPAIDPELFRIEPRSGTKVVPLEEI